MYIRGPVSARTVLGRLLVMMVVILPVLALVGAIIDYRFSPDGASFQDTFLTDLALIYLLGLAPALVTSLVHTQVTQQRGVAEMTMPRLRAAAYGFVIGLVAGFGLGLLISVFEAGLDSWRVLLTMFWSALGGSLYGSLVGPCLPEPERAT